MWRWLPAVCLLLPICAAGSDDSSNREASGSPYLSFCQERFYKEERGRLFCNWAVNFNFACFVSYPSNKVIQAGAKLAEPEVVGKCDNGEPVVKLLHY